MTTPIIKIYPSASLEQDVLEQRIEKKLNHAKRFNNSSNKIEGKNLKSKKKHKNYKNPNSILKSVESIVIIGARSTSISLSVTDFGLPCQLE